MTVCKVCKLESSSLKLDIFLMFMACFLCIGCVHVIRGFWIMFRLMLLLTALFIHSHVSFIILWQLVKSLCTLILDSLDFSLRFVSGI